MKNLTFCVVLAGLSAVLAGCIESEQSTTSDDPPNGTVQSYPNINMPLSDFSANIINDATGVGDQTLWSCVEPPNNDEVTRTQLTFYSDGTGTYSSGSIVTDVTSPMTWSLVNDDLLLRTSERTVIYSNVSMPIPSAFRASILQTTEPDGVKLIALEPGDGTGEFSCRAVYRNTDLDPLPLPIDVFANGATAQTANSSWSCPASPTSTPYPEYTFDMLLGADGSGIFNSWLRINEPVTQWQVDYRTLTITAADGTSIEVEVLWHYGDRLFVRSTVDGVFEGTRECELLDNTSELVETNDVVKLGANVRVGTRSSITIDYRITNVSTDELISFDGERWATAEIDSDGMVTVYKAKRDTGSALFESLPTIAGQNLSPGQTLEGTATISRPMGINYPEPAPSVDPRTFNFCVGYGKADDFIPLTLVDGTYGFNSELHLQSLTCQVISTPSGPVN